MSKIYMKKETVANLIEGYKKFPLNWAKVLRFTANVKVRIDELFQVKKKWFFKNVIFQNMYSMKDYTNAT